MRLGAAAVVAAIALAGCAGSGAARAPAQSGSVSVSGPVVGPELQLYPAGLIAGVRAERSVSAHGALSARLAYNLTDRRDFGEHDDESGGGPGGGLGYRWYFDESRAGWLAGLRVDLWDLEIDWQENGSSGTTDVLVLQPTAEAAYAWRVGRTMTLDLGLSLGAEINVDTDGQDVGEGAILLAGVGLRMGF
jgi:hypothetical protein